MPSISSLCASGVRSLTKNTFLSFGSVLKISQRIIDASLEAENKYFPSGVNSRAVIQRVCPLRTEDLANKSEGVFLLHSLFTFSAKSV